MTEFLHKTLDCAQYLQGAGAYEAPAGKNFPPHQHTHWELVYYRTGHILCPVGNEVYTSQPGMFLLTPPFTVHAEYARTAYANYFIAVNVPADHPWSRVCFDDEQRSLGQVCGALVREWRGRAEDREEMLTLLVGRLDLLLRRARAQRQQSAAERTVSQAEALLEERFAGRVTIEEVAREVGVSPSGLRAQFAQVRGSTPLAHLQRVRLQHALPLLRTSTLTLEAVADMCGYHSASHMSRYVKRETGKSPGQLRRL